LFDKCAKEIQKTEITARIHHKYLLHNLLSDIIIAPRVAGDFGARIWYERHRILVSKVEPIWPQPVSSIAEKREVRVEVARDRHLGHRSRDKLWGIYVELEAGALRVARPIDLFFFLLF